MHNGGVIYGYARVSTDGQSVVADVAQRRVIRSAMVFRGVESGAKTTTRRLQRALNQLDGPHRAYVN
jgi:DNA invertase Pin-like site-specific DNA recombinase